MIYVQARFQVKSEGQYVDTWLKFADDWELAIDKFRAFRDGYYSASGLKCSMLSIQNDFAKVQQAFHVPGDLDKLCWHLQTYKEK